MEKIHSLIDILYRQKNEKASPELLLSTIQLIQSELVHFQRQNLQAGTPRVAVTMPLHAAYHDSFRNGSGEKPLNGNGHGPVTNGNAMQDESMKSYMPGADFFSKKPAGHSENNAAETQISAGEIPLPGFQDTREQSVVAPTLVQHQRSRELHETLATPTDSLNEKLKEEKTEIVHKLKESPIQDLRKAIGINDRFTFIHELFRGDEAMYERSIKTINNFQVFPEADTWISRELRLKLAWDDDNPVVQGFFQLIRRRFV